MHVEVSDFDLDHFPRVFANLAKTQLEVKLSSNLFPNVPPPDADRKLLFRILVIII